MVYNDDCMYTLTTLGDNSIDSIVTDPPYELKFMNNKWDTTGISFNVDLWKECLRVLKPGGFLLSFSAPRLQHRLVCAIEDAGFRIVDGIIYMFGTGMSKGQNIGKTIEKKFPSEDGTKYMDFHTQLKSSYEYICVAQKPTEGTFVENVLKYGVGAFNIGACRIKHNEPLKTTQRTKRNGTWNDSNSGFDISKNNIASANPEGRFPTNIILDELAAEDLGNSVGKITTSSGGRSDSVFRENSRVYRTGKSNIQHIDPGFGDTGTVARYFYCAKASKKERGEYNTHTTVKPLSLMKYLVRLVTPPEGTILDPFMGSGTTGIASLTQGFNFIGIEKEKEYYDIALKRMEEAQ